MKGKVIFSSSHPKDASGHYEKLGNYVGADTKKTPCVTAITNNDDITKFRL